MTGTARDISRNNPDTLKLPSSAIEGKDILRLLDGNVDFKESLHKLQASVKDSGSSYKQYQKNNLRNGTILTEKAFDIVNNNPEAAYLFINPRSKEIYSKDAQSEIIRTAQKNSAFVEGLSFFKVLERGINKTNLMSLATGRLYNQIVEESRDNVRGLTARREEEERAEKLSWAEKSRKIDENRPLWQQSPHTRNRRKQDAVELALATPSSNYHVEIKDPGLLKFYEEKTRQSAGLIDPSDPIPKAVGTSLQQQVDQLSGLQEKQNIKGQAKTNLEANLRKAQARLKEFNEALIGNNQMDVNAASRDSKGAVEIASAIPKKITQPIPEAARPIPAQVIREEYFITTARPIRDVFIKKNGSEFLRVNGGVPRGLKIGEKFNLTADVSIERVPAQSGNEYKYNLVFHNLGNYQIRGAIHDWGTNFGSKAFNIQDNAAGREAPTKQEAVKSLNSAKVPQQLSEATPLEKTIKQNSQSVVPANQPPINAAPLPEPKVAINQSEKINQSLQELNSRVLFLDQHKHFLSNEKASQWYWYIDARQKEIKNLKASGDTEQLEAAILKTKNNLDEINKYLDNYAKTKAVGYQVHEVVELDAYGRQVKILDVYWSANNVQSMQSSQANYENFYTQQGNIASRHRTFTGGWVSYCNQNQQVVTFYSHNFSYKGLSFK